MMMMVSEPRWLMMMMMMLDNEVIEICKVSNLIVSSIFFNAS